MPARLVLRNLGLGGNRISALPLGVFDHLTSLRCVHVRASAPQALLPPPRACLELASVFFYAFLDRMGSGVCVFIYVCMHACLPVFIFVCMCVCLHACMHVFVCVCICVLKCLRAECRRLYVGVCVCTNTCARSKRRCMYFWYVFLPMYADMRTCIYICIMHMHKHVYT